ncbi:MAG: fumarylacetoacetate hydrolase family protein [Alphaproteobacteria bacterium]
MTPEDIDQAAGMLAASRRLGGRFNRFPEECRPRSVADGYAIQHVLHGLLGPVAGYKIGCTTPVMQKYLGIDHPCAGGIFADSIHPSPAALKHRSYRRVGVECEIAVRMDRDLTEGPFTRDSVAAAVGECMAAIELVDDRYLDYTQMDAPSLIADDFFSAGCVLGPACRDWRSLDLAACAAFMTVNGRDAGRGTGAMVLGHPLEALVWLAGALAEQGRSLKAGDIVMTGSMVETRWLEAGDWVDVTIEGLGVAAVSFT